jgi:hypothetical protein
MTEEKKSKHSWLLKEPDREPPMSPLLDMAQNSGAGGGEAHKKEDSATLQNVNMKIFTEQSPHYVGKTESHGAKFPLGEIPHGKEKRPSQ